MAFLRGFRELVPQHLLRLFSSSELQLLIGGTSHSFDVDDMAKYTNYGGGYHPDQLPIQWFWEIVRSFSSEEKSKLLSFATSCSRAPLLGFSQLYPKFAIQQVRIQNDADRLPTAATCMNLLKLPAYSNKNTMREKLLLAINANAGFDLS